MVFLAIRWLFDKAVSDIKYRVRLVYLAELYLLQCCLRLDVKLNLSLKILLAALPLI